VTSDDLAQSLISAFISCSCLSSSTPAKEAAPDRWPPVSPSAIVPAQDFDKTVVPITELKLLGLGIEGEFGTGFCLDPTCRFVATNYHVAISLSCSFTAHSKGKPPPACLPSTTACPRTKPFHPGASGRMVVDTKTHHIVAVPNAVGGNR
jgi:hypothetical protein